MVARCLTGIILLFLAAPGTKSADIDGAVVIRHKLTKRKVTASVSSYQRGIAVESVSTDVTDPLAFERSHVAIYLEGPAAGKPSTATMEQNHRRFLPDMLVISAGSTVSFPNLDPIFHNVFSLSQPKTFDLGNYPKDQTRKVTFPKPGIVFVNCRLHPNMTATIVVTPNQWNTTPDAEGRFMLSNIPAGSYQIVAWHKAAGLFRQTIDVDENHRASVRFVIPIDENGMTISQR